MLTRRLTALSTVAIRFPRQILLALCGIGIMSVLLGAGTPARLSNSEAEFFSRGTESYTTGRLLKEALGVRAFPNLAVLFPTRSPQAEPILRTIQKVASLLPATYKSLDKQATAVLGYFHRGVAPGPGATHLAHQLRQFRGVLVGGSALASEQLREQVRSDLIRSEVFAFPLLLLLALVVFRSVVAAALPLLTAGLTFLATLVALRPINALHPVSILCLDLVMGLAVGLSLDYGLLLVSRYREELSRAPRDALGATHRTVVTAGRTVAISSATVASAFACLLVFPLGVLRSIAIGGMLAGAMAGVMSLLVLPAALSLLGPRVNAFAPKRWQLRVERTARPMERGGWYRLARFVMRRPIRVALTTSLALLAMGAPSLAMRLTGFDAISLPADTSSHRFEARMKSEFEHPFLDEVIVAAHGTRGTILHLVRRYMEKLPDVAAGEVQQAKENTWMFRIATVHGPFSNATEQLVRRLRAGPANLKVTGATADYLDTLASLREHLPVALLILFGTTLTLLFLATGSVVLPLKAIVMNILSLAAAFGLVVSLFQQGRLEQLLSYHSVGALVLTQPILIGACTFGILTDYGMFLLTRIREAWDSGLPNGEAVALGLERTGRIVTAAALLFCVAVGSLITAHLTFVKEAGFGVAAAVAIDASLVRALLVPSLMILLGRWNWWRPKVLRLNG